MEILEQLFPGAGAPVSQVEQKLIEFLDLNLWRDQIKLGTKFDETAMQGARDALLLSQLELLAATRFSNGFFDGLVMHLEPWECAQRLRRNACGKIAVKEGALRRHQALIKRGLIAQALAKMGYRPQGPSEVGDWVEAK